jgi:hypothetical protein
MMTGLTMGKLTAMGSIFAMFTAVPVRASRVVVG